MPRLGIILPNMGITGIGTKKNKRVAAPKSNRPLRRSTAASMADALFTTTQQRVLGVLYGQPERSFSVSEMIALTRAGSGAVQRELARLVGAGLLTRRSIEGPKRYQVNPAAPIHAELLGIVQKTTGWAKPLVEALVPLSANIWAAFVCRAGARRTGSKAAQDGHRNIELLVVSDTLGSEEVLAAIEATADALGRDAQVVVHTRRELARRIKAGNATLARVLALPKLWLIGNELDLTD